MHCHRIKRRLGNNQRSTTIRPNLKATRSAARVRLRKRGVMTRTITGSSVGRTTMRRRKMNRKTKMTSETASQMRIRSKCMTFCIVLGSMLQHSARLPLLANFLGVTLKLSSAKIFPTLRFVGQIPRHWTEKECYSLFEEFGAIYAIKVLKDRDARQSKGRFVLNFKF